MSWGGAVESCGEHLTLGILESVRQRVANERVGGWVFGLAVSSCLLARDLERWAFGATLGGSGVCRHKPRGADQHHFHHSIVMCLGREQ